ncbi:unnamed protein product [Adineta steineri]|uniref:G-patch domain-containing protein n=1 Tax=Adineta steineri TaxID=433720 RepID=A0A815KS09_9BILA|nr:unnamed protein product [Adineta steineri]
MTYGSAGHWTRTVVMPPSADKLFVSIVIDQDDTDEQEEDMDEMDLRTGQGHEILSEQDKNTLDKLNKQREEADRGKDDTSISTEDKQLDEEEDELEEWDRHEAQYDDVTKQDRTSPYFFEHKIELKWEKGGSGLVFYTDDVFWKEHEGQDFDNLDMADDIDIDMRMYHESAGSADRVGNELQAIRREEDLRQGRLSNETDPEHKRVGVFEKHTKGIGRRLLERQGWRDGQGLGSSVEGMAEALSADGGKLSIKDKTGLGYTGEKIERNPYKRTATSNRQQHDNIHITTVYDNPEETDPAEPHNLEGRLCLSKSNRRLVKRIQPANTFNGTTFGCVGGNRIRLSKLTDVAATIAKGNKIEKIHSLTITDLKYVESNVNGRPKPRKYGQ